MSKGDRINRKLRKIDNKYARHQNRRNRPTGGWSGCTIRVAVAAFVLSVVMGVRIKKTPPPGRKRGCWAKAFGG